MLLEKVTEVEHCNDNFPLHSILQVVFHFHVSDSECASTVASARSFHWTNHSSRVAPPARKLCQPSLFSGTDQLASFYTRLENDPKVQRAAWTRFGRRKGALVRARSSLRRRCRWGEELLEPEVD